MKKISVTQRFDSKWYVYTSDHEQHYYRYRSSGLVMVKLIRLGFKLTKDGVGYDT